MLLTKSLASLGVAGLALLVGDHLLAQTTGIEPMSSNAQLGIAGGVIGLLGIALVRVIPGIAASFATALKDSAAIHAEALEKAANVNATALNAMGSKLDSMQTEIHNSNKQQLDVLRQQLSVAKAANPSGS